MESPSSPVSPSQLEQNTCFDLVRKLGEGGMGYVYEALQHGTDGFSKRVAIKLIRERVITENPQFLHNFVGEAKLVAQLVHPNIVQTYQLGRYQDVPFIAMEYLEGMDLLQLLNMHSEENSLLPVPLAVFIASRICRGLAYAHSKLGSDGKPLGIVHRDVSPQNIMISREGDVKLTDFGLAKAFNLMVDGEGEVVVGKVRYMSPEQARGEHTDGRSDLFSVGVVLSEMLVGVNVFAGENSSEELERILVLEIPNFKEISSDLDPRLVQILEKSLERDPHKRFSNAEEMLVELERFIYSAGYGPTSETLARYIKSFLEKRPARTGPEKPTSARRMVSTRILKRNESPRRPSSG